MWVACSDAAILTFFSIIPRQESMRSTGRLMRLSLRVIAPGIACVLAACSSDSGSGPAAQPTSIVFIGSNSLAGTVGAPLPNSLQIEIRDSRGNTVPNISFTVTVSHGSVAGAATKTVVGTTSLGTWTLGTTAGTQTLTVASAGLPSLVLNATATAGPPAVVSTEGMATTATGNPGGAAPITPQIRLSDAFGNALSGLTVGVVIEGGGSVQIPNPVTNSNGFATVGSWTLGSTNGTQSVKLSVPGTSGVTFTVQAGSLYHIDVRYVGTAPPASIQQAFADAVARVRQFISGDLPEISASLAPSDWSSCIFTGPAVNETIDDLLIFANIRNIDGSGGLLGRAAPCFVRNQAPRLPVLAQM
jgi:hypothetical protein